MIYNEYFFYSLFINHLLHFHPLNLPHLIIFTNSMTIHTIIAIKFFSNFIHFLLIIQLTFLRFYDYSINFLYAKKVAYFVLHI